MKRVTGIGGVFITSADPNALRAWYQKHLGIDVQAWGGTSFRWTDDQGNPIGGTTAWCIGDASKNDHSTAAANFMVNYRVADLDSLVRVLKEEGCNVLEKTEESEFGKFSWVMDPDGNKVELWEPPAGQ